MIRTDPPCLRDCGYLEVPELLLPLLLGLLELLPLEPMPLLLGLVVLLPAPPEEAPPLEELPLAPPVAPLELAPDFSKYASHSERDTWPSLFLSTVVKLGAELEAPLAALPPADELSVEDELGVELDDELGVELDELPLEAPEEPLLPVALGEDDDLSLLEAPVEDEPELWAIETLASANSAAAVAVVINFNFIWSFLLHEKVGLGNCAQSPCNTCA